MPTMQAQPQLGLFVCYYQVFTYMAFTVLQGKADCNKTSFLQMILYLDIKIEENDYALKQQLLKKQAKKSKILQSTRININCEHSKSFGQIGCKVS